MNDITSLLKFLHGAGTSIIPWVVLVVVIWLLVSFAPDVKNYLKTRNDAKLTYIQKEGERNEIIRNCSATIEACTAALEMVSNDRKIILEHIDSHEDMSRERMEHIQTVVNQCRDEVLKSRGDIKAINSKIE